MVLHAMRSKIVRPLWRKVRPFGIVVLVGCNTLSGSEDFRYTPDAASMTSPPASPDGAGTPEVTDDGGGPTASAFVCPRGLADCNHDSEDGCEVDTQTDGQNCGTCGAVCTVAGSICVGGKCGPPPMSCKALLAAQPNTPTGVYMLDPDGEGGSPAFEATCDMETASGGWTLVFNPTSLSNATTALDYTIPNGVLLSTAAETLLVFRDEKDKPVGTTAVFSLPTAWKQQAPFRALSEDLNVQVKLDGAAPAVRLLRYGTASFHDLCTDDWVDTQSYGRICIAGTTAPYYAGFAIGGVDLCVTSAQSFNKAACTTQRHFTIGVR